MGEVVSDAGDFEKIDVVAVNWIGNVAAKKLDEACGHFSIGNLGTVPYGSCAALGVSPARSPSVVELTGKFARSDEVYGSVEADRPDEPIVDTHAFADVGEDAIHFPSPARLEGIDLPK